MKKVFLFSMLFFFSLTIIKAQDIVGTWKTIDDETGKAKSVVKIYKGGDDKYYGKIIKLFREVGEDQNPKCTECSGSKKDQLIIGMIIISGMEKDGDEWEDGTILDPKNGNVYDCEMEIIGGKLEVRGYLGFSFIGRTQVWEKYTE
jgi:uncharacterized protein (DUF2147 family)